jgi:hypothetical protein
VREQPRRAALASILSACPRSARRGAPFDAPSDVCDASSNLSIHAGGCCTSRHGAPCRDAISRRPVEAPCDSSALPQQPDRPFWNHLEQVNLRFPGVTAAPDSRHANHCDHVTYRPHHRGMHHAPYHAPPIDRPHAAARHVPPQAKARPAQEVILERLIVAGRLIDLVI